MTSYHQNDWNFKITDNNGQFDTDSESFWVIMVLLTKVLGLLDYTTVILPIIQIFRPIFDAHAAF